MTFNSLKHHIQCLSIKLNKVAQVSIINLVLFVCFRGHEHGILPHSPMDNKTEQGILEQNSLALHLSDLVWKLSLPFIICQNMKYHTLVSGLVTVCSPLPVSTIQQGTSIYLALNHLDWYSWGPKEI